MTCFCGKTALTQVNGKGFCKEHRSQAEAAMRGLGNQRLGKGEKFATYTEYAVVRR